jgi:hypothetical protein
MYFPEPWAAITDAETAQANEAELQRELPEGHVLAGESVHAIARRQDRDDILFALSRDRWAIVHLTWRGAREPDQRWPTAVLLASERELADRLREDSRALE